MTNKTCELGTWQIKRDEHLKREMFNADNRKSVRTQVDRTGSRSEPRWIKPEIGPNPDGSNRKSVRTQMDQTGSRTEPRWIEPEVGPNPDGSNRKSVRTQMDRTGSLFEPRWIQLTHPRVAYGDIHIEIIPNETIKTNQIKDIANPLHYNYYQKHVLCTYLYEVCAECGSSACINISTSHIPSPLIFEIELHSIIIFVRSLELRQINLFKRRGNTLAYTHGLHQSQSSTYIIYMHAVIQSYNGSHTTRQTNSNKCTPYIFMCALYTAYIHRWLFIAIEQLQCIVVGLPSQLMNNICHNNACNNWSKNTGHAIKSVYSLYKNMGRAMKSVCVWICFETNLQSIKANYSDQVWTIVLPGSILPGSILPGSISPELILSGLVIRSVSSYKIYQFLGIHNNIVMNVLHCWM